MTTTQNQPIGQVHIFTGDGKGKTSAALGTAVRGLSQQWRVGWVAWYKEASWGISEYELPAMLTDSYRDQLDLFILGKGFFIPEDQATARVEDATRRIKVATTGSGAVIDDDLPEDHHAAAQAALATAHKLVGSGTYQLLVFDEICNAINDGLLDEQSVLKLLAQRGSTHIVLTGRNASKKLIDHADLVSRIEKVKHPFDQGKLAVRGLDF